MNPKDCGRFHHNGPVSIQSVLRNLGVDEGRPDRDCPITKDEILDLKILLNTTKDVNLFLQEV